MIITPARTRPGYSQPDSQSSRLRRHGYSGDGGPYDSVVIGALDRGDIEAVFQVTMAKKPNKMTKDERSEKGSEPCMPV